MLCKWCAWQVTQAVSYYDYIPQVLNDGRWQRITSIEQLETCEKIRYASGSGGESPKPVTTHHGDPICVFHVGRLTVAAITEAHPNGPYRTAY